MEKLLTVSIAAYNVENFIDEALIPFMDESIIDKLEIFVIDDGGSDSTIERSRKYQVRYPESIYLIHKDNGGWGSTVNYGIQNSTAKYFKQLDGDDFFNKDTVRQFIELLEGIDSDVIYTPYTSFEDGTGKIVKRHDISVGYEYGKTLQLSTLNKLFPLNMHSCTFRTSILKEISILEHCFYTDVEYMLKALTRAETITFLDIDVYQYRVARVGQSMSVEGLRKHYLEHERVVFTMLDYYFMINSCDTVRKMYARRMREMIGDQYMVFMYLIPTKQHKREIIEFDRMLKEKYSEFYKIDIKRINFLRKTGFFGYKLFALDTQKRVFG